MIDTFYLSYLDGKLTAGANSLFFSFLFHRFLKAFFSSHRFMIRQTELNSFFFASQDLIFCSLIASELLIVDFEQLTL